MMKQNKYLALATVVFALALAGCRPVVDTRVDAVVEAAEVATPEATEVATEEATPEATEVATEEATPEATEVATEEATPEPTVAATEEATPEATEVATEEATPEPTVAATEEATPEATEVATEEATPEATEVATEEATPEPTVAATEEVTPEATEVATEEATPEPTVAATEEATPEATVVATEEATPAPTEEVVTEGTASTAQATVIVRSLRVRAEPGDAGEVIFGIKQGEVYNVIGMSDDGLWAQLAIPDAPAGMGWVAVNFVTVEGSIADATVTETPAATETPATGGSVGTITAQPRLRIRAEANAEAEIVGFGYPGQQFPVVEVSADGLWVFLGGVAGSENPNGGWAAAEFVTISE